MIKWKLSSQGVVIGSQARLKIWCSQERMGSSPIPGTKILKKDFLIGYNREYLGRVVKLVDTES